MIPFTSGQELLCCQRARGGGFLRVTQSRQYLDPQYTLLGPLPPVLPRHLLVESWSGQDCHSSWREGSGASQGRMTKQVAKRDSTGLESHCLGMSPSSKHPAGGDANCPQQDVLSWSMSFLLRKEHSLLQAVLGKGKNKLCTLGGSSLQHTLEFHLVLQEKQKPKVPLNILLLLKVMRFVSIWAYIRMTVFSFLPCNQFARIYILQASNCSSSVQEAPFHFYVMNKEITCTIFRTT